MIDKEKLIDKLFTLISTFSNEAITLSDYLTDNPEVSGNEINSSKKIIQLLIANNIIVEEAFCDIDYAFKANVYSCEKPKLRLGILAEFDALPEIGHGCGHSASGAISILSALAISKLDNDLPIEVDLIGTPDEEVVGSKTIIADQGVFDQYDAVIMIHMSPVNRIAFRTLAVKDMEITFKGQSGHASASPWEGRNALNGLQLFYHAVDMLRQHVKPDVRIHGVIKEGGQLANIVPDFAKAHFFIRSDNKDYLEEVIKLVKDCAKGASIATQTSVETKQLYPPYYEIVPNEIGETIINDIYHKLGLKVTAIENPTGSTDMGNVSYHCPAFHPMISIGKTHCNLHTREFSEALKSEEAHQSIVNGAKIIGSFLIELLVNDGLLNNIKQEHIQRMNMIKAKCITD